MNIFYEIAIKCYALLIRIASFFSPKAKLWVNGRKGIWTKIQDTVDKDARIIWVHCASTGEFEQGRPVIEAFRATQPEFKLMLTFFSPSGYELRKNYPNADYIFYLPIDSYFNAKRFIELTHPEIVYFIKYEFWRNYLYHLKKNKITAYSVSAIFRKNQAFFRWYGAPYRQLLTKFEHFYVQNQESVELLHSIGVDNCTITGDTRFDRVLTIASQTKDFPLVDAFKADAPLMVCGSTWEADENLLVEFINELDSNFKFIIVPHEIHESGLRRLEKTLKSSTLRYSKATVESAGKAEVLIIDNVGMLSSLYKFAEIAYIGGGFGSGIHNILEAATFCLPVLFGPNYARFQEAVDLIAKGGAFSVHDYDSIHDKLRMLIENETARLSAGAISRNYVEEHSGATQKILQAVKERG